MKITQIAAFLIIFINGNYAYSADTTKTQAHKDKQQTTTATNKSKKQQLPDQEDQQQCGGASNSTSCPLANDSLLDPLPQLNLDKTPPK